MIDDFRSRASTRLRGNLYEDFFVGQIFEHHWGKTLLEGDNSLFTTLTLSFNPLYLNKPFATAHGHPSIVINPLLLFNTVFGLSVEDCSEIGGPFLGVNRLTYHRPVYAGDTVTARSTTLECRVATNNPANGIVTWHTEGFNQDGQLVIDFERSNLVKRRAK